MQNAGLDEVQARIKIVREISITSDMQMILLLMAESEEELELLDESERGEWRSWLKTQHSEN